MQGNYQARIGNVNYLTVNDAVDAADKIAYNDAGDADKVVIDVLEDTRGGFDIGVETGDLATFKKQNIELNLNGHTLTLGEPVVGSTGTKNKGIRVLARSKLVVKNGTLDVTDASITKGMNIYGECELDDVTFVTSSSGMDYTVRNRGILTLKGATTIPNSGDAPALVIEPYSYSTNVNINAVVICNSENVKVGDVAVRLEPVVHEQTHAVNSGVPEVNISAGNFGTFIETGFDKLPVGGITGGLFASELYENLCAPNYIPTAADAQGRYSVEQASYVAKIGETKYTSLALALAAVPTETYPNTPAQPTTITLLANEESGFDVGVETYTISTFKTQNVILDLDGHTLTLGHTPVGSSANLKSNGMRVLAFSKLEIRNGNVSVDTNNVYTNIANYGTLVLDNVHVSNSSSVWYTINNRGNLTLEGNTSVADGSVYAITNAPYDYPESRNVNVKLNVDSKDVVVGKIHISLNSVVQSQNGSVNSGVPEMNISAGAFGTITETGSSKTPVGNITGGTFANEPAEIYIKGGYVATQIGNTGYYVVTEKANDVSTVSDSNSAIVKQNETVVNETTGELEVKPAYVIKTIVTKTETVDNVETTTISVEDVKIDVGTEETAVDAIGNLAGFTNTIADVEQFNVVKILTDINNELTNGSIETATFKVKVDTPVVGNNGTRVTTKVTPVVVYKTSESAAEVEKEIATSDNYSKYLVAGQKLSVTVPAPAGATKVNVYRVEDNEVETPIGMNLEVVNGVVTISSEHFCDIITETVADENRLYAADLSLEGQIKVGYYMTLTSDFTSASDNYIQFAVASRTIKVPVTKYTTAIYDGVTCRIYDCPVYVSEMRENITVSLHTADGAVMPFYVGANGTSPHSSFDNYSVKAYWDSNDVAARISEDPPSKVRTHGGE